MKKSAILLLIIIVSVLISTGCQNNNATPAASQKEAIVSQTPSAQPPVETTKDEPKYTPADILGKALNPLYGLKLPENFTLESVFIHTPGWDIIGNDMQYHMYLLAPKDNETIIQMAGILGVTSKEIISGYIDAFQKEGHIMIDGSETEGGVDCICEIKGAPKDNGWEVQLVAVIEKENEGKYAKFIEDNYNTNVFGTVSKSMTLMPVPYNFKINVCYMDVDDMMKTEFEVIYTIDNRPAVMDSLLTGGDYDGYDSTNKRIWIDYGELHGDIWFTGNNNQINVHQECKGISDTPLRDYVYMPVMTLETYGFQFDPNQGTSLYEDHEDEYSKLGFHSPAWGGKDTDWAFEFLYSFKEGCVVAWYRPEDNKYDVRIERGGEAASYSYSIGKNVYEAMYPDKETLDKYLNDLYADPKTDDLYAKIFGLLEQYSLDISGKEFAKLASLPPVAGDSFAPMSALPALPKAGSTRTTLATMGFEYLADEGGWLHRDTENKTDIHIYSDAWKVQTDDWNKNVIRYFNAVNGHQLVISCYPNEGKYEAQIFEKEEPTEEGAQSYFVYDSKNKVVLDKYTMGTDMKPEEFFPKMLGIPQTGTVFTDILGIFDTYIIDQFGMTPDALFKIEAE